MVAAEIQNHFMGIADTARTLTQKQLQRHPTASISTSISTSSVSVPRGVGVKGEVGNSGNVLGGDVMKGEEEEDEKGKVESKIDMDGKGDERVKADIPPSSAPTPILSPTPTLSPTLSPSPTSSPSLLAAMMRGVVPSVRAVAYATPPCVCEVSTA